jgi:hypothetical protein
VSALTLQSDQFSLGSVLHELAAGKRAFVRGSDTETMTAIIREDAAPLPPRDGKKDPRGCARRPASSNNGAQVLAKQGNGARH